MQPDTHRAANEILRDIAQGRVVFALEPPEKGDDTSSRKVLGTSGASVPVPAAPKVAKKIVNAFEALNMDGSDDDDDDDDN
jgi:hypothetical protein